MANNSYRVSESDGKFRVVLGGKPQPSVDNGGYRSRQEALDAAMRANRKMDRGLGSGKADEAADKLSNRRNRVDKAVGKATGN